MEKKRWFTTLVLLLIFGASVVYYMWNKPHRTAEFEKPFAILTADALLLAFETDEQKANADYLNKSLQVDGVVSSVTEEAGVQIVYLATESPMGSVSCALIPKTSTSLKEGDKASIKGICKGYLTDVILEQSTVVE